LRVSILDRYLTREYVWTFLAILGVCVTVLLLHVFFGTFDDIARYHPAVRVVALYFFFRMPGETVELIPMLSILAVLFSVGLLSKNFEVLAMHACGISYTRLCAPVAVCGVVLSMAVLYGSELILPYCEQKERVYLGRLRNKELVGHETDQFKPETHGMVYYTEYYDNHTNTMAFPVVFEMSPKGGWPVRRIQATQARLVESREDQDHDLWQFDNAVVWEYDPKTGEPASQPLVHETLVKEMPKHLEDLLGQRKKPSEMNIRELAGLIDVLQSSGENTRIYSYDLQHKLAFPFSTLILMLIGYTISVRAHVRPMVVGIAYGLTAGIAYYVLDALCKKLGYNSVVPSWAAGWFPNFAFFLVVAYRMRYVNQVRD